MAKKVTLKELRARMDWTQEETAKKLGVTLQTYNAWEQDFGKVKISLFLQKNRQGFPCRKKM